MIECEVKMRIETNVKEKAAIAFGDINIVIEVFQIIILNHII